MAVLEALKSTIAAIKNKEPALLPVTSCHAKKLCWRWALVSQHQLEGASEVVGQRAAVGLFCQGQEEGQEQQEQEEQLQWQRCPAHAMQVRAHASRALLKHTNQRATQKNKLLRTSISNTSNCQGEGQNSPCGPWPRIQPACWAHWSCLKLNYVF